MRHFSGLWTDSICQYQFHLIHFHFRIQNNQFQTCPFLCASPQSQNNKLIDDSDRATDKALINMMMEISKKSSQNWDNPFLHSPGWLLPVFWAFWIFLNILLLFSYSCWSQKTHSCSCLSNRIRTGLSRVILYHPSIWPHHNRRWMSISKCVNLKSGVNFDWIQKIKSYATQKDIKF